MFNNNEILSFEPNAAATYRIAGSPSTGEKLFLLSKV
jgi:hypothetical protein